MPFEDRSEAGRALGERLQAWAGRDDVIVLGLPPGGVVVAAEVAATLGAPLDVLLVRALAVPRQDDVALGAVASGGVRTIDYDVVRRLRLDGGAVEDAVRAEEAELERCSEAYLGGRPALDLTARVVIIVDDGFFSGHTARAAAQAVAARQSDRVVIAAPVAMAEVCEELLEVADEVVCLETPEPFDAVDRWYRHFPAVSDEEVSGLLERWGPAPPPGGERSGAPQRP